MEHGRTVTDDNGKRRYPLACPVCKTAMVGQKTDASRQDYDRFECLLCGTVVTREDSTPDNATA
jgi:transposase-like protein